VQPDSITVSGVSHWHDVRLVAIIYPNVGNPLRIEQAIGLSFVELGAIG
jgi:hypothetical protein